MVRYLFFIGLLIGDVLGNCQDWVEIERDISRAVIGMITEPPEDSWSSEDDSDRLEYRKAFEAPKVSKSYREDEDIICHPKPCIKKDFKAQPQLRISWPQNYNKKYYPRDRKVYRSNLNWNKDY